MPQLRFKLQHEKCIQGIHFLALNKPGITQYYIGKVFFFADREHLLDWGRPISGDRYVAMEHGPVPSAIYDFLKDSSGEPDEILDALNERIVIEVEGNKRHVRSRLDDAEFSALSESDREYLLASLRKHAKMSFITLRALSHQDPAYEAAWSKPGLNNEMDPSLWLAGLEDQDSALAELLDSSTVAHHKAA